MLLTPNYFVAVYSLEQCSLCTPLEATKLVNKSPSKNNTLPDSSQLETIQRSLLPINVSSSTRMLILVPDSWLSVSVHRIDHIIPSSLLPLAALSYAVETTFSPPDSLMFSYQQDVLPAKQAQLKVFACSSEWAEQLSFPFKPSVKHCLVMSFAQWASKSTGVFSWSQCSKQALSVFQPEKEKQQKTQRLWLCLMVFSVLVNGVAYGYYTALQQDSDTLLHSRQAVIAAQSAWESSNNEDVQFVTSVLSKVQALPTSARLTLFESSDKVNGETQPIFFQVTLPKADLELLLENWKKQHPAWRWEVTYSAEELPILSQQKEVVDASVSVFEH